MAGPHIRLWFDFVCPYCYVALERATWLERDYGALIQWQPFDLHPEFPREGLPRERIERKRGPDYTDRIATMIRDAGLPLDCDISWVPNSRNALVLSELGRERGVYRELQRRLFEAYWAHARDIGDPVVLADVATGAGIEHGDALTAIEEQRGIDDVWRSTDEAFEIGIAGVPAFVFDGGLQVPGALGHADLARIVEGLGFRPRRAA